MPQTVWEDEDEEEEMRQRHVRDLFYVRSREERASRAGRAALGLLPEVNMPI